MGFPVLQHALWQTQVLDSLYPRQCCECGASLSEETENGLCWDCRSDVHPLGPPWCQVCGLVVAGRVDHAFTCSDCQHEPPAYDQARSLFHYEGGVRTAIHDLKYYRDFSVIPDLSRILFAGLNAFVSDPYEVRLVPVPLHRKRLAARGFNQGLELISGMRRLDKRLQIWQGLKRIKNTETQTRLSKAARKSNVRGAFRVSKQAVPERIVLVDDVMTTGATLDACARVLKRSGVHEVITLTVARG